MYNFRLISQWVRQPLRDINVIQERLDIVETLIEHSEIRRQLHEDHMRRIPDFQIITKKLIRNKGNLQDCYKLFQVYYNSFISRLFASLGYF